MNLEQLQRAKSLEALINSSNRNIEHLEQLKSCEEIMIVANTSAAREAVKGIYYNRDAGNIPPIYYSGKTKNTMIDVAIKENADLRDKHLKELEKL